MLDPVPWTPIPGQHEPPPPTVMIDDNKEYEIEEILDSKVVRWRPRYYFKWTGYNEPIWEPAKYHANSEAVEVFPQQYHARPGLRDFED